MAAASTDKSAKPAKSSAKPADMKADMKAKPEAKPEAAKSALDDTSGVTIKLSTKDLPSGVTGITSAEGTGVHPSAFEGTFKLSVNGLPADADVIAVNGKTYAKNSLLLPDWSEIDPADYGAPDPAKLMDPDGGFSGLLAAAMTRAPNSLPISTAAIPTPPAAPSTSKVSPAASLPR